MVRKRHLAELKQAIEDLESVVTSNRNTIIALKGANTRFANKIKKLEKTLEAREKDIKELKEGVKHANSLAHQSEIMAKKDRMSAEQIIDEWVNGAKSNDEAKA